LLKISSQGVSPPFFPKTGRAILESSLRGWCIRSMERNAVIGAEDGHFTFQLYIAYDFCEE
jgi:hypothetical protein